MASKTRGVPPPSPEVLPLWEEVLQLADEFRADAPWEYATGNAMFGVRDPVSGEVDWCRILGQERLVFGLGIYPGDESLATLQYAESGRMEEFDEQITQRAILLSFTKSAEVLPQCKAILKTLRRSYRGATAWPELLFHEPGFMPIPPRDPVMLRRIANSLRGLLALSPWLRQDPARGEPERRDLAYVTEPPFGAAAPQLLPLPKFRLPPPDIPAHDRIAAKRVQQGAARRNGPWFLDWFSGCGIEDGPEAAGRPFFYAHLLLYDLASRMMLQLELRRIAAVPTEVQQLLLVTCAAQGLPRELIIRRNSLVPVLQPLADDLGITLTLDPDSVEVTRAVVDNMVHFLSKF